MTSRKAKLPADQTSGSPIPGEPVFLVVGKLRRPHGLVGEIIMDLYTDFPERLEVGSEVFLGEEHVSKTLQSRRWHGETLLVTFVGYHNSEAVGEFRNQLVYVRSDDRPPLPEGDYYHHQIIGLLVTDETGNPLGTVVNVLETGANDIFVVKRENGSELLIPVIDEVVLKIDLKAGELRVHLLPGLLPED